MNASTVILHNHLPYARQADCRADVDLCMFPALNDLDGVTHKTVVVAAPALSEGLIDTWGWERFAVIPQNRRLDDDEDDLYEEEDEDFFDDDEDFDDEDEYFDDDEDFDEDEDFFDEDDEDFEDEDM